MSRPPLLFPPRVWAGGHCPYRCTGALRRRRRPRRQTAPSGLV